MYIMYNQWALCKFIAFATISVGRGLDEIRSRRTAVDTYAAHRACPPAGEKRSNIYKGPATEERRVDEISRWLYSLRFYTTLTFWMIHCNVCARALSLSLAKANEYIAFAPYILFAQAFEGKAPA